MRKITLSFIAIFLASLCSLTARAERVAPTFPKAQTLESGKTYFLYNVGSGQFMYRDDSYVNASSTQKNGIIITAKGNETYTMQFDNNGYLYTYGDQMYNNSNNDQYARFRFTNTEGGYTIQRNYSYDETQFVGINSSNYIYANLTTGNLVWQLFDAEGAEAVLCYNAKKALYDALESAEVNYAWAIADFEAIYKNEASTNAELNDAATDLNKRLGMSNGHQTPWWNERPILFYTADGSFGQGNWYTWEWYNNSYTSGGYFSRVIRPEQSSSISATVLVEEASTLVYATSGSSGHLVVSVDDVQKRDLYNEQYTSSPSGYTHTRFFEELEPGLHTITWTFTNTSSSSNRSYELYDVGVMSKPQIMVSLLEPGSLGTEVLYKTDHVKNVRRLKVKGTMNNDDWARIKMMSTLLELDLSEAQFTEIPARQFQVSSSDTTMNFLHKVVLPEGLTTIGDKAFRYSFVEDVNLPSTMRRVGDEAFAYSHVKELIMPDDMTDFYNPYYAGDGGCFERMYWLNKVVLPKNLTRIPYRAFNDCCYITDAVMPEKLQSVGGSAFYECRSLNTTLPEGLKTIEDYAFYNCGTLNSPLPSTLTSIGRGAFQGCNSLTDVKLNVNLYALEWGVFRECGNLETLKLMSPTVVTIDTYDYPLSDISKMVLQVPHYLVNSYKQDSYWYNAKSIESFDYSDTEYIPLHGNLTLTHERFGGTPSVLIDRPSYLKVLGDGAQQFNNLTVSRDYNDNYGYGQLYSDCPNLSINGDLCVQYKTNERRWNFICLPFDLDISRISHDCEDVQFAIRYYDGANRAANGKNGSWKDYDRTAIIPAGTGFILQTNKECFTYLYAADTEAKQNIVKPNEFSKTLQQYDADQTSDRGWNLVGNPYQCFYNNHMINYTAPITVWNFDSRTYTAYSLTDDDYTLRPNEAFFVQCPGSEALTISFPVQGRQLTSVIESQNAARSLNPVGQSRFLVDLGLSYGDNKDKTRVVFNNEAGTGYDITCDAGKFMSMDKEVAQLYTLDAEGLHYAINERPIADGKVQLGIYTAQNGAYTLSAERNHVGDIYLTDLAEGICVNLANGDYTFNATAGTDEARFVLSLTDQATDINELNAERTQQTEELYDLSGRRVSKGQKGVFIQDGKKVVVK